jgi:hypothetical protein
MQQLYLSDLGDVNPNAAPDVTTLSPDVQIEANKGESAETLSPKKGENTAMSEQCVPDTPVDEGVDEETQNIKIAEDALKSLVDSVSGDKVVPDAPASLAQDQPLDDDLGVQQDKDLPDHVIADST